LATLLDAPENWEFKYNQLVSDRYILRMLNRFSDLANSTPESNIQSQFIALVSSIAFALEIDLVASSITSISVVGILAHYQYDICSKTDPQFSMSAGETYLHQKSAHLARLKLVKCGITALGESKC
jgi:hypothetical protein